MLQHLPHAALLDLRIDLLRHELHPSNSQGCGIKPGAIQTTLVEGTTAEQNNPFRYIAGYQNAGDQPGGYYKLGARYYNPTTGAFTQPDPEPGNLQEPLRTNPYIYAGCDPINNADPSGRWWSEEADCYMAIAGLGLAIVGLAAAVASGPGLFLLAIAGYGISGADVLGSCYDENGEAVIP